MAIYLKSDQLTVTITEQGAELTSIKHRKTGIEYLWQGDPDYWGRHAPVLFPIVGRLKNNQYTYQGKTYSLNQHGFARDQVFQVVSQNENEATLQLTATEETKSRYPFDFSLLIRYVVSENSVQVTYAVENRDTEEKMYFSIGAHPGFNVPLTDTTSFEDYYLSFLPRETRKLIPLEGLFVDTANKTIGQTNTPMALSRKLFEHDALIYETAGTNTFSIESDKTTHKVSVTFEDFPYTGIWSVAQKEAPFVCIEPWFGIADTTDASGKLEEKTGIQSLEPQQNFEAHYQITVD